MMLNHNAEDPQILLFEDAELKTSYNMEDLTRQIFLLPRSSSFSSFDIILLFI